MEIYLRVQIHDDGRVEPTVDVASLGLRPFQGELPGNSNLDTVRHGTNVTHAVLDFAESIKREAYEVAG